MKVWHDEGSININQWLGELKRAWEQHDIDAAVALFSDDVEYWETPFSRVAPGDLHDLWQDIRGCIDTNVTCEVYAQQGDKYAVVWSATWNDTAGKRQERAGTYLVTLNGEGKCNYFYRTSMPKEAA